MGLGSGSLRLSWAPVTDLVWLWLSRGSGKPLPLCSPHPQAPASCAPPHPGHDPAEKGPYLKHGEEGLREVVKGAPPGLHLIKVELPPKELHPQEGEDDDEEEEQQQERGDGAN